MASKQRTEQQSPTKKKFTSPLCKQKYVKGISTKFKANLKDFSKSTKHSKKGHFDLLERRKLQEKLKGSPIRYQLGGDCTDPLNLNSLIDRDPSFVTPQASPSPRPVHEDSPIPILEPRDKTDPLNLKCIPSEDGKDGAVVTPSKKKRKKRKRHCGSHDVENDAERQEKTDQDLILLKDGKRIKKKRRKRPKDSCSEQKVASETEEKNCEKNNEKSIQAKVDKEGCETVETPAKKIRIVVDDSDNISPANMVKEEPKVTHECTDVEQKNTESSVKEPLKQSIQKPKKKGKLFIYGNYNRYYGYRNNQGTEDARMKVFKSKWFEGKDILDVGCNVGHLTLTIARDFAPHLIVGIDIDSGLVRAAQSNLRYYAGKPATGASASHATDFPISFALTKGPLSAPVMHPGMSEERAKFPHNIFFKQVECEFCQPFKKVNKSLLTQSCFIQENYVPADEQVMARCQPMYDTILCLSLTKWVHLNWGDGGIKRMFQKIFRNLRQGGRLILEPQPFASYKKKKNLTENIRANYDAIRFRPEHFTGYLLSPEVGFASFEALEMPSHKAAGFRRPLFLFKKAAADL